MALIIKYFTQRLRTALVLALCVSICACTTMRPVPVTGADGAPVEPKSHTSHVQVGDELKVTTRDGESHRIKVTSVSETAVDGTTRKDAHISIPTDEITAIKRKQVSVAKTAGLTAGTLVVLYVLAAGAAFAAVAGGWQ
jgi:hypothetical protein